VKVVKEHTAAAALTAKIIWQGLAARQARVAMGDLVSAKDRQAERDACLDYFQDENHAMDVVYEKLAGQGLSVHKSTCGRILASGRVTAGDEHLTKSVSPMRPQRKEHVFNFTAWRHSQRQIKSRFLEFLNSKPPLRQLTFVKGEVLISNLPAELQSFTKKLSRASDRRWLMRAEVQFLLRKIELPVVRTQPLGQETVWLHAAIVIKCKVLGKKQWKQLLRELAKFVGCKVHDDGLIRDNQRLTQYLFKNPLVGRDKSRALTHEPLTLLPPVTLLTLYQALKGRHFVESMGEFDQVNRELAKLAAAAKHEGLKYLRDRAGAGSEFDPDSPRVVSYRCSESTWSAILVNFDGTPADVEELVKVAAQRHKLHRLSSSPQITASLCLTLAAAMRVCRLRKTEFVTNEIEMPSFTNRWRNYDAPWVNAALANIRWLTYLGGEGAEMRWKVDEPVASFQRWLFPVGKHEGPPLLVSEPNGIVIVDKTTCEMAASMRRQEVADAVGRAQEPQ
jgi:hypothetical protein